MRFNTASEGSPALRGNPPRPSSGAIGHGARAPIEIAFVNNMPDLAAAAAHAQFLRLVRAAFRQTPFNFRCYLSPNVPRSAKARWLLRQTHEDLDALFDRGADALIVTGAEPLASRLTDEPYWADLANLVDWAREHTSTSLWSCLAAHAAVQRLDGIARRRSEAKLSGVYAFERDSDDWLMREAGPTVLTPHSRYNGLAAAELAQKNYRIASWSDAVGVDVFWRREPSRFVFMQGHPEYYADTLLREYRRDARRFLSRDRSAYPAAPENYFSVGARSRLEKFRARALSGNCYGDEANLEAILSMEKPQARWGADAARLYRNWLAPLMRDNSRMSERRNEMRPALHYDTQGREDLRPADALELKL